jgi:putative nucleotidyltransferase with HDIG domain
MQINVTYTVLTATTTTVSSSLNPSTHSGSVTFTATVTRSGDWNTPTGTVYFQDSGVSIGTGTLSGSGGTATAAIATSSLSAGSHSITAIYSGDVKFAGSTSSTLDQTVKSAAGFSWALIGGILVAAAVVALFFLLIILRVRRKHPLGADVVSRDIEVTADDAGKNHGDRDADAVLPNPTSSGSLAAEGAFTSDTALLGVEDVSTHSIQLERELERSLKKVERSMHATIQALCRTVETKDPYVGGHQKRVSQLACTIAKEMGLTAQQIEGIRVAGLIHDIGKIAVPTEILSKPGKLSDGEFSLIKDHPMVAFDILKNIEFDWPIARIVVQHHERMDGSGYPYGIPGKDILLEARILAVADVVEAMSSHRPYRPALGVDKALAEVERGDGTLYDSDVVRAFKKVIRKRGVKKELSRSPA